MMAASTTRFAIRSSSCQYSCFGRAARKSLLRRRCGQRGSDGAYTRVEQQSRGLLTLAEKDTSLSRIPKEQKCATSGVAASLGRCQILVFGGVSRRVHAFPRLGDVRRFQSRSISSAPPPSSLMLVDRADTSEIPTNDCSAPPLLPVKPAPFAIFLDGSYVSKRGAKICDTTHADVQLLSALARSDLLLPRRRFLDGRRCHTVGCNSLGRRHFSTKGPGPTIPIDEEGSEPSKGTSGKEYQRTDADFAEYLSGKNDVQHIAPMPPPSPSSPDPPPNKADEASSSTTTQHYEWQHLHRDHPALGRPSTNSETYRDIERRQQTNLERSRARTAANVRRALSGNLVIAAAKFGAWASSGSSAMLSEFVHSVVDCGNQSLLLLGLRDSGNIADRRHPYGYGKSVYFWALVSALGTFFLGAGVSMTNAVGELIQGPSLQEVTWQVWGVLGLSFAVDGYVLGKTVCDLRQEMPKDSSFFKYVQSLRDPATLAILLEDGAACLGIVIAIAGIGATQATSMPVFDGLAGVSISALLAAMGLVLVRVNHRFLLGHAVDSEITEGIKKILLSQRSIEGVQSVQSQWTGPETFSYKAEVDFDGTFLAAKLMPRYQKEFLQARDTLDQELRVLLSWYAEDVMRTVERDIRHIEAEIRREYPGAEYIELEPMSKDADRFAIDDGMEAQLKRIEIEALNRYLKSLYQPKSPRAKKKDGDTTVGDKSQTGAK